MSGVRWELSVKLGAVSAVALDEWRCEWSRAEMDPNTANLLREKEQ